MVLKSRVARKKPFISKINKMKRIDFVKKYLDSSNDFWKNIIFSDECKINIFGSDGKQIVFEKLILSLKKKMYVLLLNTVVGQLWYGDVCQLLVQAI